MLRWLIRFAWRRARGIPGPAVATLSLGGLSFTLDWAASEHVPLREIMGRGEYWPTAAFRPSPGQVVVDVGANAGVFSTVAASWIGPTGRLVAIEPNPLAASRLMANLHSNGFGDRSRVVEAGASDHVGTATLYVGPNSTIATMAEDGDPAGKPIDIRIVRLDSIAAELGLAAVDLLKVDVEAVETEVLDGGATVLASCGRAVIEVSRTADVAGVIERCRRAGFENVMQREGGDDSRATIVFAERR